MSSWTVTFLFFLCFNSVSNFVSVISGLSFLTSSLVVGEANLSSCLNVFFPFLVFFFHFSSFTDLVTLNVLYFAYNDYIFSHFFGNHLDFLHFLLIVPLIILHIFEFWSLYLASSTFVLFFNVFLSVLLVIVLSVKLHVSSVCSIIIFFILVFLNHGL